VTAPGGRQDGRPRRPIVLTAAAWAFVLVGGGGILKDVLSLVVGPPDARRAVVAKGAAMLALIWGIRALAVIGGVAVLDGHAWARWLLVGWMVVHVWISLQHSVVEVLAHAVVFAALAWALFRPSSQGFFART
jgi:hypothetical protein